MSKTDVSGRIDGWRKFETSPEVSGAGFHSRGRGEKETTKRQKY